MIPIYVKEKDGTEYYLNPQYVTEVKVTHSEKEDDWCISITSVKPVSSMYGSDSERTYRMSYPDKQSCQERVELILMAMKSVN